MKVIKEILVKMGVMYKEPIFDIIYKGGIARVSFKYKFNKKMINKILGR